MIIDIRKDIPDFLAYIKKRVAQHVAAAKKQKRPKPVSMIEFGFEFGQGNELWLVFDTRPNAEPDGQWTGQIDSIKGLKRPKWPLWEDLPDDEEVCFLDLKGRRLMS